MKARGFTLVELLAAMAVILVLAGILFPALTSAKRKGLEASEISRMRQVYFATVMYEDDQSESSPATLDLTFPYSKDSRIYRSDLDLDAKPASDGLWTATTFVPCTGIRSPIRLSFGYLHAYPPANTDESFWEQLRQDSSVGMVASPWMGWPIGYPARLHVQCDEHLDDVPGIAMDGPILRINMDGSFYRLPKASMAGLIGSRSDFFFKRL